MNIGLYLIYGPNMNIGISYIWAKYEYRYILYMGQI